ncbi:hypothetical protein [Sinomonas atrocyanea]|jgi:HD superfamily phosphohydrolase YqeK
MARPHKGDRLPLSSMLPRPDALKLAELAELTDEPKSEIVARLVHDYLKSVDLEQMRAVHGQEALIA